MSSRFYLGIYYGVLSAGILANVASFIAATVEKHNSSTWYYSDTYSTIGEYTHESWACQMQHIFARYDPKIEHVCQLAVSASASCMCCRKETDFLADNGSMAANTNRSDPMHHCYSDCLEDAPRKEGHIHQ